MSETSRVGERDIELPIETYTPERRAEFLLSTAVDRDDYGKAVHEVRAMGLDPDSIDHHRPGHWR